MTKQSPSTTRPHAADEARGAALSDSSLPGLSAQAPEPGSAMVLFLDLEGKLVNASPSFYTATGHDPEALVGNTVPLTDNGDTPEVFAKNLGKALISGRCWTGQLACHLPDGSTGRVRASFCLLEQKDDKPPLAMGLLENETGGYTLHRSDMLLTILYRISNAVYTTRDLADLYPAIHGILKDLVDAKNFYIALIDEDNDRLVFPYFEDSVDTAIYEITGLSDPGTKSLTLDVIRQGRPLVIKRDDLADILPNGTRRVSGVVGTAAAVWLGAPLSVGGKIIGAMAVQDYDDPDHYGHHDVHLMTAISEQVAMAIERKRMEQALRQSERRYRTVSDSAFNLEAWHSPDGTLEYVSPSCERITGFSPEAFMESPNLMENIVHRDDLSIWREYMELHGEGMSESLEFRIFREDGRMHWLSMVCREVTDDFGQSLGTRCSMRDITDHKTMEKQLRYESLHDPLTGLSNRSLCLDRLRQIMERSKRRDDHYFAVAFLDIDRFRMVNDSLGHQVGDALLREVSYRLLRCVRSLDTVSRYAGDEFVILFDELDSPREAVGAAKRIRQVLAEPFQIGDHEVRITASTGIVLSPESHGTPEAVLQNANIAMHHAIRAGGNKMKVFNPRMLQLAQEAMTLERDLAQGIERDEFFLQYQPIASLQDERLIGFEALVRWNHPRRGTLPPGLFIPAAEETGHIIDLGLIVLREACTTMAKWLALYPSQDHLQMSVNLSPKQFTQPSLVEQITCILEETNLPPENLKLEITESTIMDNAENALSMLRRLKTLGIRLSIDDFGTGYSSLSYLLKFPVDTLKVDRSFICGMAPDSENTAIVNAVVVLAKNMGLDVVAEGVEEPIQMDLLRCLECDNVQGFYYSKPLDPDHAVTLLSQSA